MLGVEIRLEVSDKLGKALIAKSICDGKSLHGLVKSLLKKAVGKTEVNDRWTPHLPKAIEMLASLVRMSYDRFCRELKERYTVLFEQGQNDPRRFAFARCTQIVEHKLTPAQTDRLHNIEDFGVAKPSGRFTGPEPTLYRKRTSRLAKKHRHTLAHPFWLSCFLPIIVWPHRRSGYAMKGRKAT